MFNMNYYEIFFRNFGIFSSRTTFRNMWICIVDVVCAFDDSFATHVATSMVPLCGGTRCEYSLCVKKMK